MPSERIQRQIDRLLDEVEDAINGQDWNTVGDKSLIPPKRTLISGLLESAALSWKESTWMPYLKQDLSTSNLYQRFTRLQGPKERQMPAHLRPWQPIYAPKNQPKWPIIQAFAI